MSDDAPLSEHGEGCPAVEFAPPGNAELLAQLTRLEAEIDRLCVTVDAGDALADAVEADDVLARPEYERAVDEARRRYREARDVAENAARGSC